MHCPIAASQAARQHQQQLSAGEASNWRPERSWKDVLAASPESSQESLPDADSHLQQQQQHSSAAVTGYSGQGLMRHDQRQDLCSWPGGRTSKPVAGPRQQAQQHDQKLAPAEPDDGTAVGPQQAWVRQLQQELEQQQQQRDTRTASPPKAGVDRARVSQHQVYRDSTPSGAPGQSAERAANTSEGASPRALSVLLQEDVATALSGPVIETASAADWGRWTGRVCCVYCCI